VEPKTRIPFPKFAPPVLYWENLKSHGFKS
jgi:hypothetical protein